MYKILKTLTLSAALVSSAALAQTSAVWKDEALRTVFYVPVSSTSIELTKLRIDEDMWAALSINLRRTSEGVTAQADALRAAYPGYAIKWVGFTANDSFTLKILPAAKSIRLIPLETPEGPVVSSGALENFLTKVETEKIERAMARGEPLFEIQGEVIARVPGEKVMERVELPALTCGEFGRHPLTVLGAAQSYAIIEDQINAMHFRYSETKEALRRSVFDTCLSVERSSVESMDELLNLPLYQKHGPVAPAAETRKVVESNKPAGIPVAIDVSVNEGENR